MRSQFSTGLLAAGDPSPDTPPVPRKNSRPPEVFLRKGLDRNQGSAFKRSQDCGRCWIHDKTPAAPRFTCARTVGPRQGKVRAFCRRDVLDSRIGAMGFGFPGGSNPSPKCALAGPCPAISSPGNQNFGPMVGSKNLPKEASPWSQTLSL
jgi:hypothetical protein